MLTYFLEFFQAIKQAKGILKMLEEDYKIQKELTICVSALIVA